MVSKKYKLRLYPDYVLRSKSNPVDDVNGSMRDLMDGMVEVMHKYNGIGLAAPQVGILKRVIIADVGYELIALANPEILDRVNEDRLEEGCLSVPDIQVDIIRSQVIFVRGIDSEGKEFYREFHGLMARVIQHEIDHLNGILIIDYASPTEKIFMRKKLKELQQEHKKYGGHFVSGMN